MTQQVASDPASHAGVDQQSSGRKRGCALLVVNPNSREAMEADLDEGVRLMERAGVNVIRVEPADQEASRELIAQYSDKVDRVIVAGGDGTVSSTAAVLHEYELPLGILPLGTANDLARTLSIPEDLHSACGIIAGGRRRAVDLGVVNDHYFFNVAHIGLGVQITDELSSEAKKKWGVFSYLKALFTALSRSREFRATIVVDGQSQRMRTIEIAVGNGRYYGGGNLVDEQAAIDDGLLSIYSLAPQSVFGLLTLAPLLRSGQQRRHDRTWVEQGCEIEIRTSRTMDVHADGEPVTQTPARFRVLPKALEIFVPPPDQVEEETGILDL